MSPLACNSRPRELFRSRLPYRQCSRAELRQTAPYLLMLPDSGAFLPHSSEPVHLPALQLSVTSSIESEHALRSGASAVQGS